ncbi:vitellin-degrading protease-like [Hermetia illucens]|uniref:vitellin-degrading protease-like n=1 Tax=Hermetia illucens TaxID=343691 RepID=UPI0018CC2CC6|nr:vitellin-degrading protease-like [Hermetia illucens]
MQKAVLFVSLFAVASAFPNQFSPSQNSSGGRIVGGQDADIKDFPYQVSLRSQGRHFCGGSIYLANIIITATHCFYGYNRIQLTVESGTSSRTLPGLSSKVKRVVLHPNFSRATMDYDIAILLLETEIPFGPTMQPIFLAPANTKTTVGSKAIVSGWGDLREDGSPSEQLQYVSVITIDNEVCAEMNKRVSPITERMLCAGETAGGKDACQGDSGGPLVLQGKLIGVVSWGKGCARAEYPGVYASISALRGWIDETVNGLLAIA